MINLRNFLYVNIQLLDDYISAIDGFTYDAETRSDKEDISREGALAGDAKIFSGKGQMSKLTGKEVTKEVTITESAKFQRIYSYLKENDGLKYFEMMDENSWSNIFRDDFLEVLVTARFSKIKELSNAVKEIEQLAQLMEPFSEKPLIDKSAQSKIDAMKNLGQLKQENEITCVFNFPNNREYPLVAYLDNNYFKIGQDRFVGEFYVLCKVQRKLDKGQKIELDDIFESIKSMPLNRKQKRSMPKNLNVPNDFRDTVKGPAGVVIPIAVYK